ncbi:Kef-type K+ transport system membrane component KefB [Antricoccus suffuscus]|uniref:Kef-type K+ transport system membrane component KefB n=1 Tax=Antricoccus suffuscus TaxID=1629062 RepID=A0A2T1A489_9ACTN|nr:cation:proton antiporter [Antricoccus suffuscus]PRZ43409.1 Kef-type K+ transport system membrane component KefB [Antricoccus suffuscus]
MHVAALVFIDIAIIIAAARLFARIARAVGQPPVVGEIVAGIALGPSLLGLLPGDLDDVLFPARVLPYLEILAQLGLVLFMFIVGLELDMALIRGRERVAGTISLASVALPFGLAALLAVVLYPHHKVVNGEEIELYAMTLFLGVAMAITAFPVLARILTDRGMHRTPIGVLALACAAIDDILAWTLLALVVALVQGNGPTDVIRIVALTVVFAAFMFGLVRPLLVKLLDRHRAAGRLTPDILAVVLVGVMASAFITDIIGIHAIFGAFIFGAVMPRKNAEQLTREILERLEQVSVLLLLPLFFVVTGLSTNVGGISLSGLWQLGLILLVAIGGKFFGAYAAARAMKVSGRQAAAIGTLMNTRGLTELVILQIGRELGVLDNELFTLLVLMALITTIVTGPMLRAVYPDRMIQRDIDAAERALLGVDDSYRVLVVVDAPARADRIAAVGAALIGTGRPGKVVLTRFVRRATSVVELGAGIAPDLSQMAATMDDLNALASRVREAGARTGVLCRFSVDPWSDLVAQAAVADAAIVVVDTDWYAGVAPNGGYRGTDHDFSLAVVDLGSTTPLGDAVLVHVAAGADGRSAVMMASAAAISRQSELLLSIPDGGRAAKRYIAALAPLAAVGVRYRLVEDVASAAATSGLVFHSGDGSTVGPEADTAARPPTITVSAGQSDADAELSEALGKLVPASPPAS